MTRLGSLLFCATLGLGAALSGCSSGGGGGGAGGSAGGSGGGTGGQTTAPSILDLVPRDNTVSGWTVDQDPRNTHTAGQVAAVSNDFAGTTALIDGGSDAYYTAPYIAKTFVEQNYVNTSLNSPSGYIIKMYIIEMTSADQASGIYTAFTAADSTFDLWTSNTWTATSPVIGTGSRITNSGSGWWVNFYKGSYYVEVLLSSPTVTGVPETDTAGEAEAARFATAIASKM